MELNNRLHKIYLWILYLAIIVGVVLALFQFFFDKFVWLDEAMLSLNIRDRNFTELLQPLDYVQVAPIGFLYIQKLLTTIFGFNEFVLRVTPLLSWFVSLYFMYKLTFTLFKDKTLALLATAIFSTTLILIIYSNEIKQYSSDVMFAIVIFYLTVALDFKKTKSILQFAIAGAIIIWFSNVSVIMLTTAGLYLLVKEFFIQKNYRVIAIFTLWAISLAVYYTLFIYHHPSAEIMKHHWASSFLPLNRLWGRFIYYSLRNIYMDVFSFDKFWYIPAFLSIVGLVILIVSRQFTLLFFVLFPIALHFALSSQGMYPFSGRFILYMLPALVILFAYSVTKLFKASLEASPYLSALLSLLLLFVGIIFFSALQKNLPFETESMKKELQVLEKQIKKGDSIYVYYGAVPSFDFYEHNRFRNRVVYGALHRGNLKKYTEELSALHGNVWVVFSHARGKEESYILNYLKSRGSKILLKDISQDGLSVLYYFKLK